MSQEFFCTLKKYAKIWRTPKKTVQTSNQIKYDENSKYVFTWSTEDTNRYSSLTGQNADKQCSVRSGLPLKATILSLLW